VLHPEVIENRERSDVACSIISKAPQSFNTPKI
jgi:hypothetical protein